MGLSMISLTSMSLIPAPLSHFPLIHHQARQHEHHPRFAFSPSLLRTHILSLSVLHALLNCTHLHSVVPFSALHIGRSFTAYCPSFFPSSFVYRRINFWHCRNRVQQLAPVHEPSNRRKDPARFFLLPIVRDASTAFLPLNSPSRPPHWRPAFSPGPRPSNHSADPRFSRSLTCPLSRRRPRSTTSLHCLP